MEISRELYIFLKNSDKRLVEPKLGTAAIRSQSLLSVVCQTACCYADKLACSHLEVANLCVSSARQSSLLAPVGIWV